MPDAVLVDSLPPQNHEAEVAVLGSMLAEKESMLKAMDMLREEDFYEDVHRRVFAAIRELHDKNVTPDAVTVGEHLQKNGCLSAAGGATPPNSSPGSPWISGGWKRPNPADCSASAPK